MSTVAAPAARVSTRPETVRARSHVVLGYIGLALLAYMPVLLSSRGKVAADTKQYLYLDPGRLLARASSMWDPHIGAGTVTHQNIGYLFPMGPYYWLMDKVGFPDWVAQRLWLGSLLFAAGAGVLYLFRTFGIRGPGVVVAALAFMLTPYSLDYSARISVLLMPWAALPWMIGVARKALRDGGWRYPAIFALIVQIIGGVNATALLFALLGPAIYVVYAWLVARDVDVRRVFAVTWRAGILTLVTSAWWIAGLRMQGGYGLNVLKYTETVEAVARTSTPNEVLRGLGYWFFYGQDRLGPWIEAATDYTQRPLVILAGYGLVALALLAAGLLRWRHRAFFLVVMFVGVLIAVGAYPYANPSPFGALFKAFANQSTAGLAMRSTGRAVPLVVLGLVVVLGLGVNAAYEALRASGRTVLAVGAVAVVVGMVLVNFPALIDGNYYGKNLERAEDVPAYWQEAAAYLDRGDHGTRVLELPGADFASYRWGNTVDPITPGLMDRPYLARELIPYGTSGTADLLNAIDRRLQEGVTDPKGLVPLLRRFGVGAVVLRNDIQYERYDVVPPREVDRLFTKIPGLGHSKSFGTPSAPVLVPPHQDEISLDAPPNEAPAAPVVVYPVEQPTEIARAEPIGNGLMVAGDGEGLVDAADVGLLDGAGAIQYSGSFTNDAALRKALGGDTVLVVTDQNRERARRWTSVRDNLGTTDGPGLAPLTKDPGDARLDLFPGARASASTITRQEGVKSVTSTSYGNTITYTPEDRASQAFDADPTTAWRAAAFGDAIGQRIRIELEKPITTDHINVVQPINGGRDRYITQARLKFDGKDSVEAGLDATSRTTAGQTIHFPGRTFDTLEIDVRGVNTPARKLLGTSDAVGFAEVRMRDQHAHSDVRVHEVVEMPRDLLGAVGRASSSHPLVLVMSRDRLRPAPPRTDPEREISRQFTLPARRQFALTGSASVSPDGKNGAIDALLGIPGAERGGVTSDASEFMIGCLDCRADQAIDGDPATAWQTPFVGVTNQWAEYEVAKPITFDHMDLRVIADGRHSVPTRLRLEVDGAVRDLPLPAIPDQRSENASTPLRVSFPPVTGRNIRVTVEDVREGLSYRFGARNSTTLEPAAIAELGIPGLRLPAAPRAIDTGCRSDLLTIDGKPLPVRVTGDAANASHLAGLTIAACDPSNPSATPALDLPPGTHVIDTVPGIASGLAIDRLVLASGADNAPLAVANGRVTGLGSREQAAPKVEVVGSNDTKVHVRVTGATKPFWLVLGQSQSPGWKAHVVGGDSLGESKLVDGYANGWRVSPRSDSFEVTMEWTPQRTVRASLALSALAMLLCLAIVILTWIRRRGTLALLTAPFAADGDVALEWPDARADLDAPRRSLKARILVPAIAGVAAALAVGPWLGVVAAAVAIVIVLRPSWRAVLVFTPPALIAAAGLYIVFLQHRYEFPSVFEWPTLFPKATTLAWVALAMVGVDLLIELLSDIRRGRARLPE